MVARHQCRQPRDWTSLWLPAHCFGSQGLENLALIDDRFLVLIRLDGAVAIRIVSAGGVASHQRRDDADVDSVADELHDSVAEQDVHAALVEREGLAGAFGAINRMRVAAAAMSSPLVRAKDMPGIVVPVAFDPANRMSVAARHQPPALTR